MKAEFVDARTFIGKTVRVSIDRPLGSRHPDTGFVYPVNYGFLDDVPAADGDNLDAYVLGVHRPIESFSGRCIAVIQRADDDDDKLVVVPEGTEFSDAQIIATTEFQERFFRSTVLREGLRPFGRKSRIDYLPRGSVWKTYNQNDDPAGRFMREIGFYRHYGGSRLIPALLDSSPDEYIVIERVTGDLMRDVDLTTVDLNVLTDRYVDAIVELFNVSAPGADLKDRYFRGTGADENLALLRDSLSRLASNGDECAPIFKVLGENIAKAELSDEVLIKLDWNPGNLFLRDGVVHKFIDFEQAFLGSREILVGVLLHNPAWPAHRLFSRLRDAGFFDADVSDLRHYLAFGFGSVVVDSMKRRGKPWGFSRLRTAFERHYRARIRSIGLT